MLFSDPSSDTLIPAYHTEYEANVWSYADLSIYKTPTTYAHGVTEPFLLITNALQVE